MVTFAIFILLMISSVFLYDYLRSVIDVDPVNIREFVSSLCSVFFCGFIGFVLKKYIKINFNYKSKKIFIRGSSKGKWIVLLSFDYCDNIL